MVTQSSYKPNYLRELLLIPRRSDTTTSSSLSTTISTCWKYLQSNDSLAQELYDGLINEKVSASKIRQYSPEVIDHLTQKYTQAPKIAPQVRTFISHIAKTALGQTIALNDTIATQTALWKLYATVTIPALAAPPIPIYIPPEEKIREIIILVSKNFRSVFSDALLTELFTHLESWPEDLQTDIVIAYSRSNHKSDILAILQALNELEKERLAFPEKAALCTQLIEYVQRLPGSLLVDLNALVKAVSQIAPKEQADTLAYVAQHFPNYFTPSLVINAIACLPHQNRQPIVELAGKLATELTQSPFRVSLITSLVTIMITALSQQPTSEQVSLFADWCQLASKEYYLFTDSSTIELLSQVPAKARQDRIRFLLNASRQAGYLPGVQITSYLVAHCISEDTSQEELCKLLSTILKSPHPRQLPPEEIAFFPPRSRIQILTHYFEKQNPHLPWDEEAISYTTHCLKHFEEDRKKALQLATSLLLADSHFPLWTLATHVHKLLKVNETVYACVKRQAESIDSSYIPPSLAKFELMLSLLGHEEKEVDSIIKLIRPLLTSPNGKAYIPHVTCLMTTLTQITHDQRVILIQALTIAIDSYGPDCNTIPSLISELNKAQKFSTTKFIEALHFVSEINKKVTPTLTANNFAALSLSWSWFIMEMDECVKQQAYTLMPLCIQYCRDDSLEAILGVLGCLLPPEKRMQAIQRLNPDTDLDRSDDFISKCFADRSLISQDELHNFVSKQLDNALHNELLAKTFSSTIIKLQQQLSLPSEHPLFQRAIEINIRTDPHAQKQWQSPYTLFKELQQPRNVIPDDTLTYKKEKIGTTTFRIDLQGIRDYAIAKNSYYFSDLPKGINANFLDRLFQSLDTRLDHLSAEKKQETHAYIREQFRLPYDELKPHLLQKPLIKRLLATVLPPENPVEQVHFELFSIFDVLQRRKNCLNEKILSEQEECLLSLACQLQDCATGQRDGIQFIYNNLVSTGEITSTSHLDSDFEHDFRSLLHQIIQNELNHILTSSNLLSELIGENSDKHLAHQTLYLKNRLYRQLGLRHSLTFDFHSTTISPKLFDMDEKRAICTIVAKLDIQKILQRSQKCLTSMMTSDEQCKAVYNAVYTLFKRMTNKPEGWSEAWLVFDENYRFQGVSDEGLARILEQMGILKQISSEITTDCS